MYSNSTAITAMNFCHRSLTNALRSKTSFSCKYLTCLGDTTLHFINKTPRFISILQLSLLSNCGKHGDDIIYQPHESKFQKESQTLCFVFKKHEQPELMKSTVTSSTHGAHTSFSMGLRSFHNKPSQHDTRCRQALI